MKITRRRRQLILAGLVLVMVAAFTWSRSDDDGNDVDRIGAVPTGETLRNVNLLALDGSTARLDRYRGKSLVVNFWARDCAPCRQEMPAFDEVARELAPQVAIVGVNSGDSLNVTTNYVREVNVTYDILRDPKLQYSGQEVLALPTTLFVNADGKIVSTHVGAMSADELRSEIRDVLG